MGLGKYHYDAICFWAEKHLSKYYAGVKILFLISGMLLGTFAIIFGEFDDSPGLQGLGMLLTLYLASRIYSYSRKSRNT